MIPASGITGFPSKKTQDAPLIKGPYTMNEWLPRCTLKTFSIEKFNATTVPPVSLTIPFGAPVVPEV